MLGVIHRTVIGLGPEHFRKFFVLAEAPSHPRGRVTMHRHNRQLRSYRHGNFLEVMAHSQLGAIDVYNLLPEYVVEAVDVKSFQNRLQQVLKIAAMDQVLGWSTLLSNRHLIFQHPLREFYGFQGLGVEKKCCTNDALLEQSMTHCMDGWISFAQ